MLARGVLRLTLAALLVVCVACGSDDVNDAAEPTTQSTVSGAPVGDGNAFQAVDTIVITNFEFSPGRSAAKVGDTITIRNQDTALHSVTAKDDKSLFDSGQFASGERDITLSTAGTFAFACSVHPYMLGTIQVTP